ncbi:MAG TPA: fumarylacetoacetate hydrolase family protein [Pseudonocardia sp.]|uniref:fumarylacetoacetate hydrolase family protein n=1 Tax=Pseudonocardia sp. TaxID=60912 RepID=UPI002BCECF29|nr:fumarylacetoacetate hydrolase family protein [Pseudonocardia sp.]HTF46439.1 fumarylacetoacetate hydrolase family protein [Pseudonocardia sp.]
MSPRLRTLLVLHRKQEERDMNSYALATVQTTEGSQPALALADGRLLVHDRLGGTSVRALLDDWAAAQEVLDEIADSPGSGRFLDPDAAALLTPVRYPDALLAVGANYSGHLKEMGLEPTRWPTMPFFHRPPRTSLVGPGDTVSIPRSTTEFDWECELAVVVGRPLRHADRQEARAAIAGYAIGLDLSCRDLVKSADAALVDLTRGKAQDTMAPCGPVLVPAKFMPDVTDLRITLSVNDELMMDASTSEMLYPVDEQLSIISEYMTLSPGDILFTGSPAGSAAHHGGRWLKPGDRIDARIGDIPTLTVSMRHD